MNVTQICNALGGVQSMTDPTSKYNASGSMIGYLYQCRQALLLAIDESKKFPNLSLSIERFDDVTFDDGGTPLTQIQLKHHVTAGNLTDASADIWKTLRIWSEQVKANPQLPFERRFIIMTTGAAPVGSAASKLRAPRETVNDDTEALKLLRETAVSSKNADTATARAAFMALTEQEQKNLLLSVHVHDNAPSITNARSEIEDLLAFSTPQEHISNLVDHLEGWWFNQAVKSLSDENAPSISLLTLRQKIDEIAAAFRTGDLLLSHDAEVVPANALTASDGRVFVKQMRCVDLPEGAVDLAKRDFYRATAQRSAWARENVLLDGESRRYDEGLVERWQRERLAMEAKVAIGSDDEKRSFGRDLFHWANRSQMPFRNRHEGWLCSGSYQILSDMVLLGWHPEHQTIFGSTAEDEAA